MAVSLPRRTTLLAALALAAALVIPALPGTAKAGSRTPRDHVFISTNRDFNPANGVRAGSGTKKDPFVISGWDVGHVQIKDTSAHVVIRDNTIDHLILDWIGGGAHVYRNDVGDLRVNQNVPRKGAATSGHIHHNTFGVVGQLRHWDGIFEHNKVGSASRCMDVPFFSCRGVNFDGFNGARFRYNTIYGYVEVRLHGHHHSSSFDDHSHYHGGSTSHAKPMDHTKRYHQVWVTNNTIHSGDYYGLVYTDTAHSANDRTAASERNPDLNKAHVHTTRVHLNNNNVFGAGIQVEVFNAKDERHLGTRTGLVEIANNKVTVQRSQTRLEDRWRSLDGIRIESAQDMVLKVTRNRITGPPNGDEVTATVDEMFDHGSGISLGWIDKARLYFTNNSVSRRLYGISAHQMTKSVFWWVKGLKTSGVETDVYYDSSVANRPNRSP